MTSLLGGTSIVQNMGTHELLDLDETDMACPMFLQISARMLYQKQVVPHDFSKLLIVAVPAILVAYLILAVASPARRANKQQLGMSSSMLGSLGFTLLLDFLCTDQYQPSMPDMAKDFNVLPVQMSATIQVHLLTSAIFMLILGPLSDIIGRRPVAWQCQDSQHSQHSQLSLI